MTSSPSTGVFLLATLVLFSLLGFALNGHKLIRLQTSQTQAGWNVITPVGHLPSLYESTNTICCPLLPTPQKYKEPFLLASPFSLTQRQARKFDGWWFRFLLWERPLTSGKEDYSLAHLTEYEQFKICFSSNKSLCVCALYIYIYIISNQKVHIEKQASLPTYFQFSISLLRDSNCYQIILPSRPYTLSNPTFYHGFWLREKNKYLPSIPCARS